MIVYIGIIFFFVLLFFVRQRVLLSLVAIVVIGLHFLKVESFAFYKVNDQFESLNKVLNTSTSIVYSNINVSNQEKKKLIEYLKYSRPNLIVLVEVNKLWAEELSSLKNEYPYSKMIIQEGNFGMAILSDHPIKNEKVFFDKEHNIPALSVSINEYKVYLLHAFPPIGKYGTLLRNRYLETMSNHIAKEEGPLVVCGDFNVTQWKAVFSNFLEVSGLNYAHNSATPRTWPVLGNRALLSIDHCLVKDIKVIEYRRGPNIGSDHFPLYLKVVP